MLQFRKHPYYRWEYNDRNGDRGVGIAIYTHFDGTFLRWKRFNFNTVTGKFKTVKCAVDVTDFHGFYFQPEDIEAISKFLLKKVLCA